MESQINIPNRTEKIRGGLLDALVGIFTAGFLGVETTIQEYLQYTQTKPDGATGPKVVKKISRKFVKNSRVI